MNKMKIIDRFGQYWRITEKEGKQKITLENPIVDAILKDENVCLTSDQVNNFVFDSWDSMREFILEMKTVLFPSAAAQELIDKIIKKNDNDSCYCRCNIIGIGR